MMTKKKLLVVEDELILREQISEILDFEGFEVASAENGKLGFDLAQTFRPDLILSDVMMPVMDGIEFLRLIRENEATKLVPFIFMTALAERENIRLGMEHGADDYITKPFTQNDLLKAVDARIEKQSAVIEEKEKALDKLRTNIITRLPHELRSPLSGIIGFGSLLKDMGDSLSPEDISDIGNEILNSGNRLLRLIENYLIFVQLQLSETKKEIITGQKVESVIEENAFTVAQNYHRDQALKIDIEKVSSLNISESFLAKTIFELSDNAFRFSKEPNEVIIKGRNLASKYHLTITDKGRGFTPEQIDQIGAYMQFDREILEQQGSGLGLVIAKKMVELSNGEFSIESQKDLGSTINIWLNKN